jgi:DNA-binding CsgD family transcriptional regulator
MKQINIHNEGFQKIVGGVGALLQIGFIVSDFAEPEEISFAPIFLVFALLFLASARFVFLGAIQAALFFALAGLQTIDSQNSFYGLGFAAIAVFIVFRRGWFVRNPVAKALFVSVTGVVLLVSPIAFSGKPPTSLVAAIICASIYTVLVFGLAKGRFLSSLSPKKRVLRLTDFKLTQREMKLVKARLAGRSVKELACDNGIAASTVGNALWSAYHKLGLEGMDELLVLGERYHLE